MTCPTAWAHRCDQLDHVYSLMAVRPEEPSVRFQPGLEQRPTVYPALVWFPPPNHHPAPARPPPTTTGRRSRGLLDGSVGAKDQRRSTQPPNPRFSSPQGPKPPHLPGRPLSSASFTSTSIQTRARHFRILFCTLTRHLLICRQHRRRVGLGKQQDLTYPN